MNQYSRAFMDGWDVGSDILGLIYGYASGDHKTVGIMADFRIQERGDKMGVLESFCVLGGEASGLAMNVITLGIVNTLRLGEVYCKSEPPKK